VIDACMECIVLLKMKNGGALVFFSICAVIDFVFGAVKWHSVVYGILAIVFGLPMTALLFILFRWWEGSDDSGS